MSYTRTTWQNSNTPLSAANMNNIEDGIEEALAATSDVSSKLYPVGSIHITDENVNPGTALGGTWELISKRFSIASGTSGFNFNTNNTSEGSFTWIRKEKSITFRLSWKNAVPYGDDEVVVGSFSLSTFGLTNAYAQYALAQSDGIDSIFLVRINYTGTTGFITIVDTVYKTVAPTATGATCNLLFDLLFTDTNVEDSACNQFVWRRTA